MVGIIAVFLIVGLKYVKPALWTTPSFAPNGLKGISVGAAIIFFSYIGFDAVSTAAEEAKNPQRDIPRGIIWMIPRGMSDRKSTRLNSSHEWISYAVFCLKKKNQSKI